MLMTELRDAITAHLSLEGINQKELADRARVDQATVSRYLHRVPRRRGPAYVRLCSYMQKHATVGVGAEAIENALRATWDGTPEHARALAGLLLASRELRHGRGESGGS
jgi:transcriptional regulator with XRE-family HTH domain